MTVKNFLWLQFELELNTAGPPCSTALSLYQVDSVMSPLRAQGTLHDLYLC